jgi:hypothetical protein
MLGSLLQAIRPANFSSDLVPSQLLNEETFYPALLKDLKHCQCEAVIESPFVTKRRLLMLIPVLRKLKLIPAIRETTRMSIVGRMRWLRYLSCSIWVCRWCIRGDITASW